MLGVARAACVAVLFTLVAAGCASEPEVTTGSIQMAVSLNQRLASSASVYRMSVTYSAPDVEPTTTDLPRTGDTWGGVIGNIPAGSNRTFLGRAYDFYGDLLFEGQVSDVTITAGQTTLVALTLQDVTPPPPPYFNEAPIIVSVVASPTSVRTGGTVSLRTTAFDPNPSDSIGFTWSATGGTFSNTTSTNTSWTAPSTTGPVSVTLTVNDSRGAASSLTLVLEVVQGPPTGSATVEVRFNHRPEVTRINSPTSRVLVGETTTVTAVASDGDGDPLSYQWTANCSGTWTNATSSTAQFTPDTLPGGTCNNCMLSVTVADPSGAQATGMLAMCVATSSTEPLPPVILHTYQSSSGVFGGEQVFFEVAGSDPQGGGLSFSWSATPGSVFELPVSSTVSQALWTAPSCAPPGNEIATITATLTNSQGLSTTQNFRVTMFTTCSVNGWSPTGSMTQARVSHTATVLPSGQALVAGGVDLNNQTVRTAELYDSDTGTWTSTSSMGAARSHHTATVLQSGRVLVVGGSSAEGYLATAELYDPATGTWTPTGSMSQARYVHVAELLPSGRVLVAGGYNSSGYLSAPEVYDPETGTWSAAGVMNARRVLPSMTVLPSGRVLVAGGNNSDGYLASAELYDPATNTWTPTGSMMSPRNTHASVRLPSGRVLVAGGFNDFSWQLWSAEEYDPLTGTWASAGSLWWPRAFATATLLPTGRVLLTGGSAGFTYPMEGELYEPTQGFWSSAGFMSSPRYLHAAVLLPTGKVLVTGGDTGGGATSTAELYTPQ